MCFNVYVIHIFEYFSFIYNERLVGVRTAFQTLRVRFYTASDVSDVPQIHLFIIFRVLIRTIAFGIHRIAIMENGKRCFAEVVRKTIKPF